MANATTAGQIVKKADPTANQAALHNDMVANQATLTAGKSLLPLLAVGGTAGVLGSLYDNWKQRGKVDKVRSKIVSDPTTFPMYGQESAFPKLAFTDPVSKFLLGGNATGPLSVPWAIPAAVGSLYGGYQLGKGLTNSLVSNNVKSDADDELQAEKAKYMQALSAPSQSTQSMPFVRKAADEAYNPSMFSMEKLGPAMGVGAGVLGGASLATFLSRFHGANVEREKEKNRMNIAGLEQEINSLKPRVSMRPMTTSPFA